MFFLNSSFSSMFFFVGSQELFSSVFLERFLIQGSQWKLLSSRLREKLPQIEEITLGVFKTKKIWYLRNKEGKRHLIRTGVNGSMCMSWWQLAESFKVRKSSLNAGHWAFYPHQPCLSPQHGTKIPRLLDHKDCVHWNSRPLNRTPKAVETALMFGRCIIP